MCHTQGQEGQCSSEGTIPSDDKAKEVNRGHVNGTIPEEATL